MTSLLAFLLKIGFGRLADRALELLALRAQSQTDRDALHAQTTIALAQAAVAEAKIMAEFNGAKLDVVWFWLFAAMFLCPLGLWWAAVILDSVFLFDWNVADLPTPQMQEWAGDMIRWVFYVGSGVGVVKALGR